MRMAWQKLLWIIMIIVLVACSAQPSAAPVDAPADELSGTIAVSGAFALYPMMTVWAEEFQKLHPNVTFDVQGGGAGKGMTDTLSGAVDIGMISRAIKPEEEEQGAFWVKVTEDAVYAVISANNPVAAQIVAKGISQETIAKIYITGEITTWGQVVGDPSITDPINIYTRSDASGAAEMWAKFGGGKVQDDLKGVGVNSEPAMVDTVIKDPLGIGYSNLNSVYDPGTGGFVTGAIVPPLDINQNGQADANEYYETKDEALQAVADGIYPSPPARDEHLATKGKPTGLVLTFIEWILTDGQQYLAPAGYVPLTSDEQQASLEKLK
ncbi:MAG: phosphate ABC transporter substrate-binding protein [Chloroflexi bacterium]|nr:phosphate ABC transporter substrate-binding protein [Chloroflexota bacterium]